MAYTIRHSGAPGTTDYKVYVEHNGKTISPFHDVPLWVDKPGKIVNMVIEIPRGTNAKMEISRDDYLNPIHQDVKDGKLRHVHDKYPFHYGAIPQTWEDPEHEFHEGAKGDNDPLDACDISKIEAATGKFIQAKVLGIWAMLDAGETDWKVLTINTKDPLAAKINNLEDVEKYFPGAITETFTFFRDYKIPDGKGPNKFAFDGKLLDAEYAMKIIDETNAAWTKLVNHRSPKIQTYNTTNAQTPFFTATADETKVHAKM